MGLFHLEDFFYRYLVSLEKVFEHPVNYFLIVVVGQGDATEERFLNVQKPSKEQTLVSTNTFEPPTHGHGHGHGGKQMFANTSPQAHTPDYSAFDIVKVSNNFRVFTGGKTR